MSSGKALEWKKTDNGKDFSKKEDKGNCDG